MSATDRYTDTPASCLKSVSELHGAEREYPELGVPLSLQECEKQRPETWVGALRGFFGGLKVFSRISAYQSVEWVPVMYVSCFQLDRVAESVS